MSKIGILAGGGKLPRLIGENLIKLGNSVIYFCIKPYAQESNYNGCNINIIKLESLSKIVKLLKVNLIEKIIMAGYVKRPSLKEIKFDFHTLKFIKNYALQPKGDDKLLFTIAHFFENEGFEFMDWKNTCKELFINQDYLTKIKPDKISLENLKKGLDIFKSIGMIDLSQSIIIQNNLVLGIEAAEGTDELIRRCYKYKKKGDKGILIKLSKYNQDTRFDIPVIGLNTVKLIKKYDFKGIFLENKNCIILEKENVIDYCNINLLFIAGINKI